MKFRCINNDDVDGLLTVGKIYEGNKVQPNVNHIWDTHIVIYRCDDKHQSNFLCERFEVAEDLVPAEPTTTIWEYTVEGKEK